MRDPSLHISERNLIKVLEYLFCDLGFNLEFINNKTKQSNKLINKKELARALITHGKKYSIPHRVISITTDKLEKKATKLLKASTNDSINIANLLVHVRKQLRHRGITQIKMGSKDWGLIKELAEKATEFCNDFGLSKIEGFKEFLQLGCKRLNKFSLQRLVSLYPEICLDFENINEIKRDKDPYKTKQVYKLYQNIIYEKTQLDCNYENNPQKYVYFVKVKDLCNSLGVSFEIYIKAQFEGLAWANGVPDPVQLIGDKANDRLNKYLFENNISIKKPEKKINWEKIKQR